MDIKTTSVVVLFVLVVNAIAYSYSENIADGPGSFRYDQMDAFLSKKKED